MIAANAVKIDVSLTTEESRLIPNYLWQKALTSNVAPYHIATGKEVFNIVQMGYNKGKEKQAWRLVSSSKKPSDKSLLGVVQSYLLDPSRQNESLQEDSDAFFYLVNMILSGLTCDTDYTPMRYALNALLGYNSESHGFTTGLVALHKAGIFTAETWRLMYWESLTNPNPTQWEHNFPQACRRLFVLKEAMGNEDLTFSLTKAVINMEIEGGKRNPLVVLKAAGILTAENMKFLEKGFKNLYRGARLFAVSQKANLLTPENLEALCNIDYFQQTFFLEEFDLLFKISAKKNTQDFWNNIIRCARKTNPKNSLYAYLMTLAAQNLETPKSTSTTSAVAESANNTTSHLPIYSVTAAKHIKLNSPKADTFICGQTEKQTNFGKFVVRKTGVSKDNSHIETHYHFGEIERYSAGGEEFQIKATIDPTTLNIHPKSASGLYREGQPEPTALLHISLNNTSDLFAQNASWINQPKYGIKSLEIIDILATLQEAQLLTPDTLQLIQNRIDLWHNLPNEQDSTSVKNQGERITHLAEILRSLQVGAILTKERFNALILPENDVILRQKSVQILLYALRHTQAMVVTDDIWDSLVRYSQQENFYMKMWNLVELAVLMDKKVTYTSIAPAFSFSLSPENDALMGNRKPVALLKSLSHEKRQGTWNALVRYGLQESFDINIDNLSALLKIKDAKQHHDFFLTSQNDILLGHIGLSHALDANNNWLKQALERIPGQPLTQTIWGELLACCSQANPRAALSTYTVQLLAELDRQQNQARRAAGHRVEEGGNRQGVHVQSVHATVANSLHALHQRYHASEEDEDEDNKIQEKLNEISRFITILEHIFTQVDNEHRRYNKIAIKALDKNAVSLEQRVKDILRLEKLNIIENENQQTIQTLKAALSSQLTSLADTCIKIVFPEKLTTPEARKIVKNFTGLTTELLAALGEGKFDFGRLGVAAQLDSAAQCLKRLMQLKNCEEETGFSMSKVLALVWEGVLDKSSHHPNSLNALECFIHELFNMQDRDGIKNNPACASGTLNDTLNSLNGLHQDVNIIMLDEPNILKIVNDEAKKIAAYFIPGIRAAKKDDTFLSTVNTMSEEILVHLLAETQQQAIRVIDEKLKKAKFTPDQIKKIKAGGNYDIGVDKGIERALARLRQNEYYCLRNDIKTAYAEEYPLEKNNEPSDNFEQLYQVVKETKQRAMSFLRPVTVTIPTDSNNASEEKYEDDIDLAVKARLAKTEKELASKSMGSALTTQSLFKSSGINEKIIDAFLEKLAEKNYADIVTWLGKSTDKHTNLAQLSEGIFGRQLKNYFFTDVRIEDKPFCCDNLANLADCIKNDGMKKGSDSEPINYQTLQP